MQKKKTHKHTILFLYLSLLVVTAMFSFVTYPRISENINEVISILSEKKEEKKEHVYSVLYLVNKPLKIERALSLDNLDLLHRILETVLLPLNPEEKEKGLKTYIPENTKLLGASNRDGYFFIILDSPSPLEKDAIKQIKTALSIYYNVKRIEIITKDSTLIAE